MANEIIINASIQVTNGAFKDNFQPGQLAVDQTNIGKTGYVQLIPTDAGGTVVDLGALTANGYAVLRNLDTLNYLTYGPEDGGVMIPFGKLKAGEYAVLRITPTVVLRAQADYEAVLLDTRVYED